MVTCEITQNIDHVISACVITHDRPLSDCGVFEASWTSKPISVWEAKPGAQPAFARYYTLGHGLNCRYG